MPINNYFHGARTIDSGATPTLYSLPNSSVTAIIGTAPDADESLFPLNRPVGFVSQIDFNQKLPKLGKAGTLHDMAVAVTKQVFPFLYIIRVAEGADNNETIANLVGNPLTQTGVHALFKCESLYGDHRIPRLIGAPGFTATLSVDGVYSVNVTNGGQNYVNPVAVADGEGNGTVLGVKHEDGVIQEIYSIQPGSGYDENTSIVITDSEGDGSGAAADAYVGAAANPVAAELATICPRLNAMYYIDGPDTTDAAAVLAAEKYDTQHGQLIDPKVLSFDDDDNASVPTPPSAYWLGLRAKVDAEKGFHHSVSNQVINGIGETNRAISYGAHADYLNEAKVATIINTEEGLRSWGGRTLSSEPLNAFENVVRTKLFINEAIERAMRKNTDKLMTRANIEYMIQSGRLWFDNLREREIIAGGDMWIETGKNTGLTMASGEITIAADFEPYPPMERIRIEVYRNTHYLQENLETLANQLGRRSASSIAA